jgi:hypothetical protein
LLEEVEDPRRRSEGGLVEEGYYVDGFVLGREDVSG